MVNSDKKETHNRKPIGINENKQMDEGQENGRLKKAGFGEEQRAREISRQKVKQIIERARKEEEVRYFGKKME